jgi:Tfp pilus assembly protein PilE
MNLACRTVHARSRGFTMVEAALSVGIVGVLMVASTSTFSTIAHGRQQQVESRLAYMVGQQLMAEIMQGYFQQQATTPVFGPVAGQTRSQFNYVDAYNGYTAAPPVSQAGAALTDYTGWKESVVVSYVDPSNPASSISSSTLKRITVTITAPSGKTYQLVGLRSQYGAYEFQPTVQTNYITGVSVSLKGPSPASTVDTGAHPLNITTSQ